MSFFKRIFRREEKGIGQEIKRPATIERITAPDSIKEGEILNLVIQGHFSNHSWSLDKAEAKVKGKDIIVTVVGKKKTGVMSAQALKPYQTTIEVKKLKRGKYTIKVAKGPAAVRELVVK
ncbi:MAG: hypothetical protein FK732_10365 [Asgard group archaeon]|nr:hypothetical protein [Asgard group archaeon]